MDERGEKTTSTVYGDKFWDKVKDSRLFAGLITALIGAAIMYVVQEQEDKSRIVKLLSDREVAANALQVQVFETFVEHIVPALEEGVNDNQRVALLAGLHSNFSEIFDTRPVFEAFAKTVQDPAARHELTRLAKRVARHQAEFIRAHQNPTNKVAMSVTMTLKPDQSKDFKLAIHNGSLAVISVERSYEIPTDQENGDRHSALWEYGDDTIDDISDRVMIKVKLTAKNGTPMGPFRPFELSYMDTPYMDNIWMRHPDGTHHQIALRLVDIDSKNENHKVTIEILHFPSDIYRATQRLPVKEMIEGGHND